MGEPALPIHRTPSVTIAILDADSPNLSVRLKDIASQDYGGYIQIVAVAAKDVDRVRREQQSTTWLEIVDNPSSGSAAIEAVLECATGDFIALLTPKIQPHPLWIDELVAVAVEHSRLIGVAPHFSRPNGDSIDVNEPNVRRYGVPKEQTNGDARVVAEREIESAVAAGILLSTSAARSFLPIDTSYDIVAACIDICIRARKENYVLLSAPRSKVFVPSGDPTKSGLVPTPESELMLVARHDSQSLAKILVDSPAFHDEVDDAQLDILNEVFKRAGMEVPKSAGELFLKSLAEMTRRYQQSIRSVEEIDNKIKGVEHERYELSVSLHREMAWAHELSRQVQEKDSTSLRDKGRLESQLDTLSRKANEEREALTRQLADADRQIATFSRELALLREQKQGLVANEARATDIEKRWRESEERRENALRELGVAQERARTLERLRKELETASQEQRDKRVEKESELRASLEREQKLSINLKNRYEEISKLEAGVKSKDEELKQLHGRLRASEDAFNASSKSLQQLQTEIARATQQLSEIEIRRSASERLAAELQIELENTKELLNGVTQELRRERAQRGEEAQRTGQEIERVTTLISTLESEVTELAERKSAAETVIADLRIRFEEESRRADRANAEIQVLKSSLEELKNRLAETRALYERSQDERTRFSEALGQLQSEYNELEELQDATKREREQLAKELRALNLERDHLLERVHELERGLFAVSNALNRESRSRRDTESKLLEANRRISVNNKEIEALKLQIVEANARASQLEKDLGSTKNKLAETQSSLQSEREANAQLRKTVARLEHKLADEGAHAHSLHLQNELLTNELSAVNANLTVTGERLDRALSSLHERESDLWRLRESTVRDNDALAARIVALIEEVGKPRWRGRKLTKDEVDFLCGPGAGFVQKPFVNGRKR